MNRKKAKWMVRVIVGLLIFLILCGVVITLGKQKLDEYAAQQEELLIEIENNRQVVYVVKDDKQIKKVILLLPQVMKQM